MWAVGYWYGPDDVDPEDVGWSIEDVTDDMGEAIDNLFYARSRAAEEAEDDNLWDGAMLLVEVLLEDGSIEWQPMNETQPENTLGDECAM